MVRQDIRVGIVGAGMGGLAAAIGMARGGAHVTVLEGAHALGEVGAGIQMFPNVSRLLIRWGVDKLIGDNLVAHETCKMYFGKEAKLVAYNACSEMATKAGFPWWVVRRDHLHAGLVEAAVQCGVEMLVDHRAIRISESEDGAHVETSNGKSFDFDLLVGADGVKSFTRQTLFPEVVPRPPMNLAAYRGVLSYKEIYAAVPEARHYLANTMDMFVGPRGYILCYPLSGGKECNVVTAYETEHDCTNVESVAVDEFCDLYRDFPPFIRKVLELFTEMQRWPLLQMPRMHSWSSERKKIVLLGDAAHSMQNTMGQGAATAMEDGAFLGTVISEVVRGSISLSAAVQIYEKQRMPRAWTKQQISYAMSRAIVTTDGQEERFATTKPQVDSMNAKTGAPSLPPTFRSWMYMADFASVPGLFTYDPEGDADNAVCEYLQSQGNMDSSGMNSELLRNKWWSHVLDNGLSSAPNHMSKTGRPNGSMNGSMVGSMNGTATAA